MYEYDHITEYSRVQEHEPANITLLCGTHHDAKTKGLLSADRVRAADSQMRALGRTETTPYEIFYYGTRAEIVAGGNHVYVSDRSASAIKIDGHSLVDFELVDGHLMLNVSLRDREGSPVLTIRRNELVHSTHMWDYEFKGQRLSIREGKGQIYLSILFETAKGRVIIDKGIVSHNGIEVLFDPRGLCILNNCTLMTGASVMGLDTAISVGDDSSRSGPVAIQIGGIDRGPFDRACAITWAEQKMREHSLGDDYTGNSAPSPGLARMSQQFPDPDAEMNWTLVSYAPYRWSHMSCGRPSL